MVQVCVYHWSLPGTPYQAPVDFHPAVASYFRLKPAASAPLRRMTAVIRRGDVVYDEKLGSTVKLVADAAPTSSAGPPSTVTMVRVPTGCSPCSAPPAVKETEGALLKSPLHGNGRVTLLRACAANAAATPTKMTGEGVSS